MNAILMFGAVCAGLVVLWVVEHTLLYCGTKDYIERMAPLFPHKGIHRR